MPFFQSKPAYSQSVLAAIDRVASYVGDKTDTESPKVLCGNEPLLNAVAGCFLGCVTADVIPGSKISSVDLKLVDLGFSRLFSKPQDARKASYEFSLSLRHSTTFMGDMMSYGGSISALAFRDKFDYFDIFKLMDVFFSCERANPAMLAEAKWVIGPPSFTDSEYVGATNIVGQAAAEMYSIFYRNLTSSKRQFVEAFLGDEFALGDFWGYTIEAFISYDIPKDSFALLMYIYLLEIFGNCVLAKTIWRECARLLRVKNDSFIFGFQIGSARFKDGDLNGFMNSILDTDHLLIARA